MVVVCRGLYARILRGVAEAWAYSLSFGNIAGASGEEE